MKIQDLVLIAKITSAHGLKGGANVLAVSFKETILKKGMSVYLAKDLEDLSEKNKYEIENVNIGNKIVINFKGIDSINQLEKIIPCNVYLSKELFPEASENEFYWVDLIDCKVFDIDKNQIVGTLTHLYENGAQSIFVIKRNDGSTLEIPYVKQFVKKIDIKNKIIEIIEPAYIE